MTDKAAEFYKEKTDRKFGADYESRRWKNSSRDAAHYAMTRRVLEKRALPLLPHGKANGLELGPGPGTWTEILLTTAPDLSLDLVDISDSMLAQAREKLSRHQDRLRTFVTDIALFAPDRSYQLFFSSRAIEYVAEKQNLIARIASWLDKGGKGYIVTKLPKYGRYRLLGRTIPEIHRLQIAPRQLRRLCEDNGLRVTGIFPVTFVFPLLRSAFLDRLLSLLFRRFSLNPLSALFAESYGITFEKS